MTRADGRGLTLVEMLVAILLVALAASLVVQGIGQGLGLLQRVAADQGEIYQQLMARAWLRQTLEAAVVPVGADDLFKGDDQQLQLHSFRPLLGAEGVATAIAWRAGRETMEYIEGAQTTQISGLPRLRGIEYQDDAGEWQPRWPVGNTNNLPRRVRLLFGDGDRLDVTILTQHSLPAGGNEQLLEDEQ